LKQKNINLNFTKMKKLGKLQINSEKLMKNEELISIKGGYSGDGCAGDACSSNSDCCTSNPHCEYAAGNPDQKFCFSP
jgi:hypothetical protein